MPAVLQEVPGYVRHIDVKQNHVQVQGGSNWDLSRSAIETPITPLEDPEPIRVEASDAYAPTVATVSFKKGSAVVPKAALKELKSFEGVNSVTVTGFADVKEKNAEQLAKKRAQSVAKYLKKVPSVAVKTAPVANESAVSNQKVEVTTN